MLHTTALHACMIVLSSYPDCCHACSSLLWKKRGKTCLLHYRHMLETTYTQTTIPNQYLYNNYCTCTRNLKYQKLGIKLYYVQKLTSQNTLSVFKDSYTVH